MAYKPKQDKMCHRCLKRHANCIETNLLDYRALRLCYDCRTRSDVMRWVQGVRDNHERFTAAAKTLLVPYRSI